MTRLALAFVVALIASCGPASGGPGSSSNSDDNSDNSTSNPNTDEVRQLLHEYNDEINASTEATYRMAGHWTTVDANLGPGGDDAAAFAALDDASAELEVMEASALRLVEIEEELIDLDAAPNAAGPFVALFGAAVAVYGFYQTVQFFKGKNDEMNRFRAEAEAAGAANDTEAYQAAKAGMVACGQRILGELGANLVLIGFPDAPSNIPGILLHDAAKNKVKDGLKTIATTTECQQGFEEPGCQVVVGETKDGEVKVPNAEQVSAVVAGGEDARMSLPQVDPNATPEVERESIPVDEVTPENLASNDAGEGVSTNNSTSNNVTPNNGGIPVSEVTFPTEPHGGVQIDYTIEGVDLPVGDVQTEDGDFIEVHQSVPFDAETVVISGTIWSYNNHSGETEVDPYAESTVLVAIDGEVLHEVDDTSGTTTGVWSHEFRFEVDATTGRVITFGFGGTYYDENGQDALVAVQGALIRQ